MTARILYQADGWTITQDPTNSGNLNLIRFHRINGQRKLLDQIAEWDPCTKSWNPRRWTPHAPGLANTAQLVENLLA